MSQSSSYSVSPWLTCYTPRPDASLRLFCFPHGGGGPQAFRAWSESLPDSIEVFSLSLPGRGSRRKEAPIRTMTPLAEGAAEALRSYLDKPYALFGHSVGALAAYETAALINEMAVQPPVRLIVSAHKAPADSLEADPMYKLPDNVLLEKIRELGLVPGEALENRELIDFILPPLKADFELSETYEFRGRQPLPVPLTAVGGELDSLVTKRDLERWSEYTSAEFESRMYPGDHFFTETHIDMVLKDFASALGKDIDNVPPSVMEGERAEYPGKCLHELFREQARAHPDRIAVADPCGELTFSQLDEKTDLLARFLQKNGLVVDSIGGIYMESCLEFVVAYLAILKAGGAYMPVETAYPAELLRRVLEKAQPKVILTKSSLAAYLPDEYRKEGRCLSMDNGWEQQLSAMKLPKLDAGRELPGPDSLAYCVMTSGTTGTPKGIICPHRGAVNSYYWRYRNHPYEEGEREGCNIFLVWEVIRPLLQGHPSYVIPDEVIYDPWKLVDFLEKYEITRVLFTPSLLEQVFNTPGIDIEQKLGRLKIVWLNGEVVPTALRNRFFERLPDVKLLNDYSISECHDVCTHDLKDLDQVFSPKYASLGFAMSNVRIYLLDDELKPVPQGMSAEIYVGGDSLAEGYLGEPEKTAERFIPDPLRNDGSRLFRTGDLGRFLPNGELEVKGRVEFMVKLRGYSIVPGAVEAAITEYPAVKTSVVITKDSEETGQPEALVAYIVSDDSMEFDDLVKALRPHLKERLPHYAIPSYFIPIDEIPLHDVTGKMDRKKLPNPGEIIKTSAAGTASVNNLSGLESLIADVWEEVLGVRAGNPDDNFFDLGGHSLLAINICNSLSSKAGADVSVVDIYEHPTVRALGDYISSTQNVSEGLQTAGTMSSGNTSGSEVSGDLAIIGMAGRFPGAENIDQFWRNLVDGVCSVRELSDDELLQNGIPEEIYTDPDYRKIGAVLDDVDQFDYAFWGLSRKEAVLMDPQHRLFLECCWQALENSGTAPRRNGERTGVFGGCYSPLYLLHHLGGAGFMDPSDPAEFHITETGNDKDYLATRVSYLLNLQGPSLSVQTSCSTAASVVATACQSLLAKQCDTAVAGASSITFPQGGYQYVEGHINSKDGKVRAFDAGASGTILGDGVGVLVIKRLEDAVKAGNTVVAVIKGFAVNNDGSNKAGYSAPSVSGQKAMVSEAQRTAGVSAETITYMEAHGTGTLIGDPIEIRALTDVFRKHTERKAYCALGSVKPNIGHANIASGMAGIIKTALSLYNKNIPPTINFEKPNPAMNIDESPFYVNTGLSEWKKPSGYPRRAGVSCLGIGGTNCHFVLEEAPENTASAAAGDASEQALERGYRMLVLSGKSRDSVEKMRGDLVDYFRNGSRYSPSDIAYTLRNGRERFAYRLAAPFSDDVSAERCLKAAEIYDSTAAGKGADGGRVVFMFPGQGSQHLKMGYGMYTAEPVYRRFFDECCSLLVPMIGLDLKKLVFAEEGSADAAEAFRYAYYIQPAIFSLQYSLAKTLIEWGIKPDAMAGHSIGEYAAACISGILDLEDALALVVARGRAMEKAGEGAMLAARIPRNEAEKFAETIGELEVAVLNSVTDAVFSGTVPAVEKAEARLGELGISCRRVNVKQAFHSAMMEDAAEELTLRVRDIRLNRPGIPVVSNLSGTWLTDEQALDPEYWGKHMRNCVRFSDNVDTLMGIKPAVMLEVGSHRILGKLLGSYIRELPEETRPAVFSCLRHPRDTRTPDSETFGQVLAGCWSLGFEPDLDLFHRGLKPMRVPLPSYRFDTESCWPESSAGLQSSAAATAGTAVSGKIEDIAERAYLPSWSRSMLSSGQGSQEKVRWLILSDGSAGGCMGPVLSEELKRMGAQVTTVYASGNSRGGDHGSAVIEPADSSALSEYLKGLDKAGRYPQRILYLWSLSGSSGDSEPTLENTYFPAVNFARALSEQSSVDPLHIWMITDRMLQVYNEKIDPLKSTLAGPAVVLPQENSQLTCRLIDVDSAERNIRDIAVDILRECCAGIPDYEAFVALRGYNRWVQRYEPVRLEVPAAQPESLRTNGIYIITGGLGRIAGEISGYLAGLDARIILTSSKDFPDRSEWPEIAADPNHSSGFSSSAARLIELENKGAEVSVIKTRMDSADEVAALFNTAVKKYGRIDGVFHCAGSANLKYLTELTDEISFGEFASKISGLLNIEKALEKSAEACEDKPGFVLLFSSLASILGGYSMTAYTAANRFMDAFVQQDPHRCGVNWYCVNWDDWDFEYTKEQVSVYEQTAARFAMSPEEGVETIRRILSMPQPMQLLVATRPVQKRIRQWLNQNAGQSGDGAAGFSDGSEQPGRESEKKTPLIDRMTAVYRDVLGIDDFKENDNFFEAGGDSLLASQILLKLRKKFRGRSEKLTLASIFDYPSVEELSGWMQE